MPSGLRMLTDLLIDTPVPYPALSRTTTSPPAATALIACWSVRQGCETLHGFKSLPDPETNVRWAKAVRAQRHITHASASFFIESPIWTLGWYGRLKSKS